MSNAPSRRRSRIVAATALPAVAALIAAGFAVSAPAQAAASGGAALPDTHPVWATANADRGAVPAGTEVTAQVYLASQNPAGLAQLAQAVSTPGNPMYHHYLTPAQQNARYGPSASQVAAVRQWLTQAGLTITAQTEQYVTVTGDAREISAAFGTNLHEYATTTGSYYAPSTTATVPASLSAAVLGVTGLSNRPQNGARPTAIPAAPNARTVTRQAGGPPYIGLSPCATYYGQKYPTNVPPAYGHANPLPVCGYLPKQLRGAYGVDRSGLSGKGVTVAVIDAYGSSTIASDANAYARYHGLAPFKAGQFTQVVDPSKWHDGSSCAGYQGWVPEESLDIESVHTMAPNAHVTYFGANSCMDPDFLAVYSNIVDHHLADIVSNSWSEDLYDTNGNEPAAYIKAYTQVFEQGAAEGIGFYYSSGDCATDAPAILSTGLNCDTTSSEAQATFPSSDPYATSVAATAIGIGRNNNYEFETSMGDSRVNLTNGAWPSLPGPFLFGSGGGSSAIFGQPWYQRDVVPDSLSKTQPTGATTAAPMRETPDIAMEGDLYAATMVGFTQKLPNGSTAYAEAGYGGTSVACPLFAGVQADAQQAAVAALGPWGSQYGAIGFANPEIYGRYKLLGSFGFHDVTDHPHGRTYAIAYKHVNPDGSLLPRLVTLGTDYTLHATEGYDDATGVGSPNVGYLWSFRYWPFPFGE